MGLDKLFPEILCHHIDYTFSNIDILGKSYIPRALTYMYVGYTLRALTRQVYHTYFKAQGSYLSVRCMTFLNFSY